MLTLGSIVAVDIIGKVRSNSWRRWRTFLPENPKLDLVLFFERPRLVLSSLARVNLLLELGWLQIKCPTSVWKTCIWYTSLNNPKHTSNPNTLMIPNVEMQMLHWSCHTPPCAPGKKRKNKSIAAKTSVSASLSMFVPVLFFHHTTLNFFQLQHSWDGMQVSQNWISTFGSYSLRWAWESWYVMVIHQTACSENSETPKNISKRSIRFFFFSAGTLKLRYILTSILGDP